MVNTFLPYKNFEETAKVLDYRRLNKQILECDQILKALEKKRSGFQGKIGWINHPATRMWEGYEDCLEVYRDVMLKEWISRGYNSTRKFISKMHYFLKHPLWFRDDRVFASHRSNLLRKDPIHYGKFGWTEPNNLEYYWPV
jgi:hypothetical protein